MSRFSSPMKIQLAVLASFFYLGSLAAQHITTHSGGQVNTTAVANRIATQLPAAPDLANAWFLVEKLPTQTVGGNAIRARVYSVNNLDQVMGINYIGGTTPTIWSASGAHSSGASDYTQELSSGKKINDFSRFVANKTGPSAQGGVFTFSELGGVAIEQTLPGITLHGINNFGWMLAVEPEQPGYSYNFKSYYGRHFILKGTGEVNIALPRDAENGAYLEGINITGQVVGGASPQYGYVGARGFFAEADGKIRWLTSNNNFDEAYGLNDSGQIVGTTSLPDYSSVPAFWENGRGGAIESLPTVRLAGGFENAWANGINKWGQIVGRTRAGIALWLNKRQLDFTGRLINPENLKLISLLDINDRGVMLGEQNYTQGGITYSDNFILRPIWAQLAVDANRDGEIKFRTNGIMGSEDNSDATSADRPYRFWINDDDDGNALNDEQEVSGGTAKDYESRGDFGIASKRDLEDFARLWLSAKGITAALKGGDLQLGLKWSDGYTGTPKINLYLHYESDGGTKYLTDILTAAGQTSNPWSATLVSTTNKDVVAVGDVFILKKEKLANLTEEQSTIHFLFEGAGAGKGQLVLVLRDQNGNEIGTGPSIWMDLHNVKDFYEQALATNVTSGKPPSSLISDYSVTRTTVSPAPDETKQVIVFIHGINNTDDDFNSSSNTIFKRLYWSGYRGRFAAFRWPCAYLPPTIANPYQYNLGEFYAFKSAAALRNYLDHLRNRQDLVGYAIDLYAHSQGNVVTSEALAQGATFDNYILTQGAIPAHCYDTSVPFLQKLLDADTSTPTPFAAIDGGYNGYFSGIHGHLINFYNANDFALSSGVTFGLQTNWEENQRSQKPESFIGGPSYIYDRSTNTALAFSFGTFSYYVTDMQEARSMVARSRSKAVGAQGELQGVISGSVDLVSNFGFGTTRDDHSAQFTRPIQAAKGYWDEVVRIFNPATP